MRGGEVFLHVDPTQAVFLGPVGFHIAFAGVQRDIFGHRFIGVETDGAMPGLAFREAQQQRP